MNKEKAKMWAAVARAVGWMEVHIQEDKNGEWHPKGINCMESVDNCTYILKPSHFIPELHEHFMWEYFKSNEHKVHFNFVPGINIVSIDNRPELMDTDRLTAMGKVIFLEVLLQEKITEIKELYYDQHNKKD